MSRIISLLICVALIACKKEQAAQQQAPEVPVATVIQKDVEIKEEFVGQIYGAADIEIRARVQGWVTQIHFVDGSEVKQGQLLYSIDPLPYQSKVDQARGQVAEAEAQLVKARSDLERIKPLAASNAVSQRDLVAAQGQYDAAIGMRQAADASLDNAKIELGYTRITSPIDGTIGISKADVGDYAGGINLLVLNTVSNVNSIRVRFSISEREYLSYNKRVAAGGEKAKTAVDLILADGSLHEQKGQLVFANREIDPSTGTLTLEATFPNPRKMLKPGQFARVRVVTEVISGALLVPQRAVTELQGSYQVYVVDKDNKIQIKMVEAGSRYEEYWIINKGLDPADRVALLGSAAIRVNSVVTPVTVKADTLKP